MRAKEQEQQRRVQEQQRRAQEKEEMRRFQEQEEQRRRSQGKQQDRQRNQEQRQEFSPPTLVEKFQQPVQKSEPFTSFQLPSFPVSASTTPRSRQPTFSSFKPAEPKQQNTFSSFKP